jgi:hypothetical protein
MATMVPSITNSDRFLTPIAVTLLSAVHLASAAVTLRSGTTPAGLMLIPFGRIGAGVIVGWTVTLLALLFAMDTSNYEIIGLTHVSLVAAGFVAAGVWDWRLWTVLLPFFFLQAGVGTIIFNANRNCRF